MSVTVRRPAFWRKATYNLLLLAGVTVVSRVFSAEPGELAGRDRRTGVFPFHAYAAKHDVWELMPMDQGGLLVSWC